MELQGLKITTKVLADFNRRQTLLGILSIAGGLLSAVLTFLFFWGASAYSVRNFRVESLDGKSWMVASVLTLIVLVCGIVRYRKGMGGLDYWDSVDSFLPREETAGAVVVDHYASRVTAPAFAISQMILAGPRLVLDGWARFSRRVPESDSLAVRMERVRSFLDQERKYHPIAQFADEIEALQCLGWMGVASLAPREEQLMVRISLEAQSKRS